MRFLRLERGDGLLLVLMLALALIATIAAVLLLPPQRTGGEVERPSTFFNEPYGTKAAFLALQDLGYNVSRLRRMLDRDTLEGVGALVLLCPFEALTSSERERLLEWVCDGHTLVLSPAPSARGPDASDGVFFDDWFTLRGSSLWYSATPASELTTIRLESSGGADPLLAGSGTLVARREPRFDAQQPTRGDLARYASQSAWSDELGVLAQRIQCERGRILALADPWPLTNEGLRHADNSLLLANLAREMTAGDSGQRLAFDEYHLGFPHRDASWIAISRLIWAEGWGWTTTQVFAVAALTLGAGAVRFGRPRDIQQRRRRQQGEFIRAAGRLLHEGQSADLVYEALHRHYRAQLCTALHILPSASDDEVASVLGRRSAAAPPEWLPRSAAPRRTERAAVLALAQRAHRDLMRIEQGA